MPFRLQPARDRKLYRLVKGAVVTELPKGRRLYQAGDEAREVFLVRRGHVRLVLPGMEKGDRTVAVALPWELFGDEAFTEGHRRYSCVAGTRSQVLTLDRGRVMAGLKTARLSLLAYLEGVERELHRLRHTQGGSAGPSAAQRLADVLLDLGERCGEREGRGIRLAERLTHQTLADLSGSHRATVTTCLNGWLYDGVLDTDPRGRLVLVRPTELWGLAGYDVPGSGGGGPAPRS